MLELLECDDTEGHQCQRKGRTVICRRRPQSEQTGNITKQYETKDRSDIVRKILRVVPHRILYHAIQFFHDKLHDILKRIGHFRRMLHLSVRSDRKRQQKKHD